MFFAEMSATIDDLHFISDNPGDRLVSFFFGRRLPPGPWGLPILGYLPFLNPTTPHESFTELAKKYGKIYGLYLGNVYTVVLSDAAMISSAFSKEQVTGRAPLYVTHGIMGGYGLICAEGDMWRIHRKFTAKCLRLFGATKTRGLKTDNLERIIMKEVLDCTKSIQNGCENGRCIDPLTDLQHSIGSVMCYLVYGKTWPKTDATWLWLQHLQEDGTKAMGVAGPLNFLPFLRYIPKYSKVMHFLLEGKHKTHDVYKGLIEDQSRIFDANNEDLIPENVIQAFLREKNITSDVDYFNDEQFYHLLADLFGAGLDTTLTTLRWFILYMADNPDIQKATQEEIDNICQNRLPSLADLSSLILIQAAIAETQRIRSVVPVGIPHATTENTNLFGYEIPKHSMVLPLQWAVHMNPAEWENPAKFNPNKFIDEEGKFYKPKSFMPFQSGKRICIGEELANILLYLFASVILQKFVIKAKSGVGIDLEGDIGITLTPKPQELCFAVREGT